MFFVSGLILIPVHGAYFLTLKNYLMDEKIVKVILSGSVGIIWAYVIFFVIGFNSISLFAMQITGSGKMGGLGAILLLLICISPFYIPVAIFSIIKGKS